MKVYFIHPILTIDAHEGAENFFNICINEIEDHVEVVNVKSPTVIRSIEITDGDFVAFFNRDDQEYSEPFSTFIADALKNNVDFLPIAISVEHRTPPILLSKVQSFDIVETLRQRKLTNANITTVAYILSRIIISKLQPTISKDDMQIFISYRRIDGEEIAASFYTEFVARAEKAFRDLINIRVGGDAQNIIEENLRKSDVVVFIDTPKAGESYWIKRELSIALSLNLPIVWVRVGDPENRTPLDAKPSASPHFSCNESILENLQNDSEIIDEIIDKAFKISRESAARVFDQIKMLRSISDENSLGLYKLDSKNLIYEIKIPRKGFRYYQRPLTQIVQCYGRRPKEDEFLGMQHMLETMGYTHLEHGAKFDTAILLSPIKECEVNCDENIVKESFEDYINYLDIYLHPEKAKKFDKNGIILSGAFPDCEPEFQQHLTNAVYSFSKSIFLSKCTVIFGAHPTFQHLIFDMGKMHRPNDYLEAIRLYISKFFVADSFVEELKNHCSVISTEEVSNSKDESLIFMREQMINDDKAIALICMGGKTKAGGHKPGIDEEIALAREKGLPIYLIGSVGGRSAELAQYYNDIGCAERINNLSVDDNYKLMTSIDYQYLSSIILNSLGF